MGVSTSQPTESAEEQLRTAAIDFVSSWKIFRSPYAHPPVLLIYSDQFQREIHGHRRVIIPCGELGSFTYMSKQLLAQQVKIIPATFGPYWGDVVEFLIKKINDVEFKSSHINLLASVGLRSHRTKK